MTEQEARAAVEARLKRAVLDETWERATEDRYVAELREGLVSADVVATKVRHLEQYLGTAPSSDSPGVRTATSGERESPRELAISDLFAINAAKRKDVQRYRAAHLPDGLITVDEIEDWVLERTPNGRTPLRPARQSDVVLTVPAPGFARMSRAVVRVTNAPLAGLAKLTKTLAKYYLWSEGQAAAFVLAGATPIVRTITGSIQRVFPLQARTRITMVIDPMATPREVMDWYANVRRGLLGEGSKPKAPTAKARDLAVFVYGHPSEDWEQMRVDWNAEHPAETYQDKNRFKRDALKALRSLLEPKYEGGF